LKRSGAPEPQKMNPPQLRQATKPVDAANAPDRDSSRTTVQRWLSDMSTADMIGQMSQIDINMLLEDDDHGGRRLNGTAVDRWIGEVGIGSVFNCPSGDGVMWTARQFREAAIALNGAALAHGRPPVIWGLDSVHGANYVRGAIVAPQPINIAATFNASMARQAGELASRDTRAAGIHWLFSPLLGLALEPLWSRVYETFGEDPVLVGAMAAAMIRGIQMPDRVNKGAIPSQAAACAKHFIGYSMPRTGHDRSPAWIPTRHLYQYFVPPWQKALGEAMTVMESYSEYDGVPLVANKDALNYLLRQRLNFTSVLVTDYSEIRNLADWHHVAESTTEAIMYSLREGTVDMSMIPWDADEFASSIVAGLQSQRLTEERIQTSAGRVLRLKHDLRMLDEKLTIVNPNLDLVGTDEDAVLPMVQDSIVLAKNQLGLLPLDPTKPLKIHVTGPTANSLRLQSGGWTHQWQGSPEDLFTYGSTVWNSVRQESAQWTVTYSCGVDILGNDCDDSDETPFDESVIDQVMHWVGLTPTNSIVKAVEEAKGVDITIVCVGEEAYTEKPGDIRSLDLPDGQNDLISAIRRNTDTKIILVFFGGRPRLLSRMVDQSDAVVLAFLPGPSGGPAIANILTGRVNPNGRLPITYPSAIDGGGVPYWHAVTDMCTQDEEGVLMPHYQYVKCRVQFPFGHGLSYTSFEYRNFSAIGGIDADLHATVTVTNTGSISGADTVMFFTFDVFRHTTPEYKRLRAFEKVFLKAGESSTIKITVPVDDLRFVGSHDDRHYVLDPSMISYLGVGHDTDCRKAGEIPNPDENDRCVRLTSQAPSKPYNEACEAACLLWMNAGDCNRVMTSRQCESLCMDAGDDGWGWNYVNCLESAMYRLTKDGSGKDQCRTLTFLCRDVFRTDAMSSGAIFESQGGSSLPPAKQENGSFGFWLALVSAVLTSFMMMQLIRGKLAGQGRRQRGNDERFNGIQFTTIKNDNRLE
jgi:beta-glucosidase